MKFLSKFFVVTMSFICVYFVFGNYTVYANSNVINISGKSINIYEKFDIKTIQVDKSTVYSYNSSDTSVANVDSNGIVTGNKMGQAVIKITDKKENENSLDLSVGFYKGIDVSTFNGNVDYANLKRKGIDFVMIRSSYGWYDNYDLAAGKNYNFQYDEQLYNNIKGASDYNIPFGIYHYSYARNVSEAALEAEYTINALKSTGTYANNISLPVAYDVEDNEYQGSIDKNTLTDIVITYCTKIRQAGYVPMVYASKNWFVNHLDVERLNSLGYDFWLALWPYNTDFSNKVQITNSGIYPLIWQYTSSGSVEGANTASGRVDLNIMYMKEQVKVSFVNDEKLVEEKVIDKGASIADLPKITKSGYDFVKWVDQNSKEITSNTKFNENTTLTPVFEKKVINLSDKYVFILKDNNLNLTATNKNGTLINNDELIFKSLNEDVAIVDETGKIFAKANGDAKIQVSLKEDESVFSICNVKVSNECPKGDINKDGRINMIDVYYGTKGMSQGTLTEEEIQIGDVTFDGKFNMTDVNKLLKYTSGKITTLS